MKRKLFIIASAAVAVAAHAEPRLQMTPGTQGGVLSTQITTTKLTDSERKALTANPTMMATAEVYAGTVDVTLNRNQPGMARSIHSVCFTTWLTTEADYKFTLDVGGHQVSMSDHIVIHNDRKTCVQHELYQNVNFNTPGAYPFYAITTGTTQMAGEKRATHTGTISVR